MFFITADDHCQISVILLNDYSLISDPDPHM